MISSEVFEQLTRKIRALEGAAGAEACPALCEGDFLFAHVRPGALFELIAAVEGAGVWSVALWLARELAGPRALVIVDPEQVFYPPAAAGLGIDLERTILVRPPRRPLIAAAMLRALRCQAVGAVIGWCESLRAAEYQRLRMAAEEGGGIGLLLRPAGARAERSFASYRLQLEPIVSFERARRVRVHLLRAPGDLFGRSFFLEIDDEKGHVRLSAELAAAEDSAPRM